MRMARAKTAGGGNSVKSVRVSAGSALNSSLALAIAWLTRRTRSTGSSSSVGRLAAMLETRFVHFSVSWPVRIDTGTMETRGSWGRASCLMGDFRQDGGPGGLGDVADGPGGQAGHLVGAAGQVGGGAGEHLGVARDRLRLPFRLGRRDVVAGRVGLEHQRKELRPRRAVD